MDEHDTGPRLGGRYQLLHRLGRGGDFDVHLGRDTVLDRDVAIKVVRDDRLAHSGDVDRLEREARTVAALSHPHVIVVHDVLRDEAGTAVVMELVEGGTLADRIRREAPMPWRDATQLAAVVADGLQAAHAAGLVHRDVKPSNVLLGTDGRIKVADFGIAGLAGASAHTTTVRGSIPYLAPEQARGERPDPRTDVYALGCVLHEMLTGQPPFADDHGAAVIGQHLHRPADPPSDRTDGVPPALDALVLSMLAKDPQARPDMVAVRDELQRLAGTESGTAATAVLGGAAAPTEAIAPVPEAGRRSTTGRRTLVGAGLLGVVAVGALAVAMALRPSEDGLVATPVEEATTGAATASPEPTSTAPPTEATSEPTAEPSEPGPPDRPETVPGAAEAFRRTLVAGRSDGLASGKAVEELDKLTTEVVAKHREDKPKDVREAVRKLAEKVDELVEKGEVSESLGAELADATRELRRLA